MSSFLVKEGTKYSFIVLDPPWINKSVRRKHPYNWSDLNDIEHLPIEHLIDRTRSSLVCCWSTNSDKIEEFIKMNLFQKWNCQYLTTWYWLKVDSIEKQQIISYINNFSIVQVTKSGEAVLDLTSIDKKSYETLILGYTGDDEPFQSLKATTKLICSVNRPPYTFPSSIVFFQVPALIHSSKPALHPLFQSLITFPNMEVDRCLEVYARNLLPNFTSIGNEVNGMIIRFVLFYSSLGSKTSIDRIIRRDYSHVIFSLFQIETSSCQPVRQSNENLFQYKRSIRWKLY